MLDGVWKFIQKDCLRVYIDGCEAIPENDEDALMEAVARQPVIASICSRVLKKYTHGVIRDRRIIEEEELDHHVLLTGFGECKDGTKYWKAQNSWGDGWGEHGYFRLERAMGIPGGVSGIAICPYYPVIWDSTDLSEMKGEKIFNEDQCKMKME